MSFSRLFIFLTALLALQAFPLLGQTGVLKSKNESVKLQHAKAFGISNLIVLKRGLAGKPSVQSSNYYAQRNSTQKTYPNASGSFGLGIGLDYGGFGGRLTVLPDPHLAFFLGGGYALQGVGVNGGFIIRIQPDKKFVPTISGMYGYNAVIIIKDLSPGSQYESFNKLYYGPSFGVGLISKSEKHPKNYWHFEIIVPFRSDEFKKNVDILKKAPNITVTTLPSFALFGIGYHF